MPKLLTQELLLSACCHRPQLHRTLCRITSADIEALGLSPSSAVRYHQSGKGSLLLQAEIDKEIQEAIAAAEAWEGFSQVS